jgi:hypothetical protein
VFGNAVVLAPAPIISFQRRWNVITPAVFAVRV